MVTDGHLVDGYWHVPVPATQINKLIKANNQKLKKEKEKEKDIRIMLFIQSMFIN